MLPPTYQMRPLLCLWADSRSAAGASAGDFGNWVAGIWPSWLEATTDSVGGCWSGGAFAPNNWIWYRHLSSWGRWGVRSSSPGALPPEIGLSYRSFAGRTYFCDEYAIYPSRALRDDPVPVDVADGGVVVTLGGITVRNTHSCRRQWVVDLLLDGALDVLAAAAQGDGAPTIVESTPAQWQSFLRRVDRGVTLYLYGAQWTTPGSLATSSTPWAYAGAPNRISGALVDATNIRWTPPETGKLSRYEVTITIAEVAAPGRLT